MAVAAHRAALGREHQLAARTPGQAEPLGEVPHLVQPVQLVFAAGQTVQLGVPPAKTAGRILHEGPIAGRRLTGNPVAVLEVSEREVGRRLRGKSDLWADIARHGVWLYGKSIEDLRSKRHG